MVARSCAVCSVIDEHPPSPSGFWYECTACGTRFRPVIAVDSEHFPRPYREIIRQRDELLAACEDAIQFVAAWTNNHPCIDGSPSRVGSRVIAKMQIAIAKAKGEPADAKPSNS